MIQVNNPDDMATVQAAFHRLYAEEYDATIRLSRAVNAAESLTNSPEILEAAITLGTIAQIRSVMGLGAVSMPQLDERMKPPDAP